MTFCGPAPTEDGMSHNAHTHAALSFLIAVGVSVAACRERDHSVTIPLPTRAGEVVAEATAEATAVSESVPEVRSVSYRGGRSKTSASGSSLVSAEATSQASSDATAQATSEPTSSASSATSSEPALAEPTASASTTASAEPAATAAGQLGAACVWDSDCGSKKCWWQVCTSRAIGAGCTFDGDCDSQSCGWDHKCRSRGEGSS